MRALPSREFREGGADKSTSPEFRRFVLKEIEFAPRRVATVRLMKARSLRGSIKNEFLVKFSFADNRYSNKVGLTLEPFCHRTSNWLVENGKIHYCPSGIGADGASTFLSKIILSLNDCDQLPAASLNLTRTIFSFSSPSATSSMSSHDFVVA